MIDNKNTQQLVQFRLQVYQNFNERAGRSHGFTESAQQQYDCSNGSRTEPQSIIPATLQRWNNGGRKRRVKVWRNWQPLICQNLAFLVAERRCDTTATRIIRQIGTPAVAPKRRGNSPGRVKDVFRF